jgi:hypothetical protein
VYGSDMLLWPPFVDEGGCASNQRQTNGSLSLVMLVAVSVALRRRRRRS